MTDLIFGASDLYTWKQLAPWARSIISSGFSGEVILLAYRIDDDTVTELTKLGISVVQAEYDHMAHPISHTQNNLPTRAHTMRNFHMWQYLDQGDFDNDFVIITDTRDVIFQRNPQEFLNLPWLERKIYMPSEGIRIEHEPWNSGMISRWFGPYIYNHVKECSVCNSGTFFGFGHLMKEILLQMYLIGHKAETTGMDQPILNILGHADQSNRFSVVSHDAGWACQCGVMLDPVRVAQNRPHFLSPEPKIDNEEVFTSAGDKFVIVHQYDRVPELANMVARKYGI
jgi:hypothetical protein